MTQETDSVPKWVSFDSISDQSAGVNLASTNDPQPNVEVLTHSFSVQDQKASEEVELRLESTTTQPNTEAAALARSKSFENGCIIAALYPSKSRFSFITPALFEPRLVPEELLNDSLRLTVEDYFVFMRTLVNDVRFQSYITCYRRLSVLWMCVTLLAFLFIVLRVVSIIQVILLLIGWVVFNVFLLFCTVYIKSKIRRDLELCVAAVNAMFVKYNILLCVHDFGNVSCHTLVIYFVYYDISACLKTFQARLSEDKKSQLSCSSNNAVEIGCENVTVSVHDKSHADCEQPLSLLRYSQPFLRSLVRGGRLTVSTDPQSACDEHSGTHKQLARAADTPAHAHTSPCLCEYALDIVSSKAQRVSCRQLCYQCFLG